MGAPGGAHGVFASQLAAAIAVLRPGRIARLPGARSGAVEDVIGRDMDEDRARLARGFRHRAGRRAVDRKGQVGFGFRAVHGGIGGGVDHGRWLRGPDRRTAGRGVGQVDLGARQDARGWREARQFLPHLPRSAEDEERHRDTPTRLPTPSTSSSGRHQSSFARYQSIVRSRPWSSVTEGSHPSSADAFDGSMA